MVADKPERSASTRADPSGGLDQPRIGIVHLVVWTACVAVHLGLQRGVGQMAVDPSQPFGGTYSAIATVALTSIGYGATLGGLLLWAARRWRGLAFPKHPGEYLLVVLGMGEVLRLSYVFVYFVYGFLSFPIDATRLPLLTALHWGFHVLNGLILLWPVLAVKNRRWRMFFGAALAAHVLLMLYLAVSQPRLLLRAPAVFSALLLACLVLHVAADAILVVVVLKDRREGIHYPWTHWLGVAVNLWLALIGIGAAVRAGIDLLQSLV